MNIMGRYKILFGIIFLFVLFGCSIQTDFYIQNFTQTKKTVKINYKKEVLKRLSSDYYGVYSFNSINDIVKPKAFKKNKNLKSVDKSVVDSSGIILEIAPQSTVRIEKNT
ncbi:hypothetical protein [Chryseobacterium sp. Bi04]|uniref:hypothetical protein n=1 Tax=Chryseobacterium sp. Bi04 TaxID=2822345 RepID=UPI001DF7CCB5|nr:hypothetical protein [Chryseobacterium sp. Bi04]CAH0167452.1 hypothetical protein SRABI04_01166 [Chryseobacterium sp. Bi04]